MYTEVITKLNENYEFLLDSPELICLHLKNQDSKGICVEVSTQENDPQL